MLLRDEYQEARDLEGNIVPLTWHSLGKLVITSGRILTCDPVILTDTNTTPLPFVFAPGRYPVYAATAPIALGGGGDRVMLAVVLLSDQAVVRWQAWEEAPRYIVDSGTACLMDLDAARSLLALRQADERYGERIGAMMVEQPPLGLWTNVVLDLATGANMIAMEPGLGDGLYPTRAGYGADQEVACLLLDYHVVDLPGITEPDTEPE
jgi:Protein of unknown function (DUF4241)